MFLKLGCICFGGPAAHLGYFREEFVLRRQWITEETFAELIGLTQLLPGPSSSQTGFFIGIARGGILGGIAAWLGFTVPSACLMVLFAAGVRHAEGRAIQGALHGLQIAAVAVVGAAVLSMFRKLCPDLPRALIAFGAAVFVFSTGGSLSQIVAILAGALLGRFFLRQQILPALSGTPLPISRQAATVAILIFAGVFAALGFGAQTGVSGAPLLLAFYRTGALVFGGGHVVLPLLQQAVVRPGWVNPSDFLAGYGAAQAIPGPLFTFSAYLGFVSQIKPEGLAGALACLMAIFSPGLLLAIGVAPFWARLRRAGGARALLGGVNASVVGLLLSALVHAGISGAIRSPAESALAIAAFLLLIRTRISPALVVLGCAAVSSLTTVIA